MEKQSISVLKGIGKERMKAFERLGVTNVCDLMRLFPRDYEDRSVITPIQEIQEEKAVCVRATVFSAVRQIRTRSIFIFKCTIADDSGEMNVVWFNNPYIKQMLRQGEEYVFCGRVQRTSGQWELQSPLFEKPGKNQLIGRIIPIYPLTSGLSQRNVVDAVTQALSKELEEEWLPHSIRMDFQLCDLEFALRNIHFPQDLESAAIARKRFKFEEVFTFSLRLAQKKQETMNESGPILEKQGWLEEFVHSLPFTPTGAQRRCMEEICADLESGRVMNRLLQGDVGSGKTAVAAAAIYVTVKNGYQAALMAPTEILVNQHFVNLCSFFDGTGIQVEKITGSMSAKQKGEIRERLAAGEIDLLVGTHALIQKDVVFSNLALVVTDEQHRFGVAQRALLNEKGKHAHKLVMSATPIPRTLSLILYGDLDLSVIDEMPPGRKQVKTYAVPESMRARINKFMVKNIEEGRQIYIVCPLVSESEKMDLENAELLCEKLQKTVLSRYRVALLYGSMPQKKKDEVMREFVEGNIHALVTTTVIEVGVDVKNASVMIVENAERFGLSQLHQLRGRVGRGSDQAYCVLFDQLSSDISRKRMEIMCQSNDGFYIAEQDLKLRGAGEVLGKRQHGDGNFKLADLFEDLELIQRTQSLAGAVAAESAALTKEEYAKIKAHIGALKDTDIAFN